MKDVQKEIYQYPSDFNPPENIESIVQIFESNGFYTGRCQPHSKLEYLQKYPDNIVIFNANVVTKAYGKVWYGDLDITQDKDVLMKIAEQINEPLYILHESDGRFGDENGPIEVLIKKAVWDTTQTDIITRSHLIERNEAKFNK